MIYRHGEKPLRKILFGDDAPIYLPIAMDKLRDLYRQGATVLTEKLTLPDATIHVEKQVMFDRITIEAAGGGFMFAFLWLMVVKTAPSEATGEAEVTSTHVASFFVSSDKQLKQPFKQFGVQPSFDVDYPADDHYPGYLIDDAASVSGFGVASRGDELVIPLFGEAMVLQRFSSGTASNITEFELTTNLGKSFNDALDILEPYTPNVQAHQTLPVVIGGQRVFYFLAFTATNEAVARFGLGDSAVSLNGTAPGPIRSTMINTTPQTIFGYSNSGHGGNYFLTQDGTGTVEGIYASAYLDLVNTAGVGGSLPNTVRSSLVSLFAASANRVLILTPRPGPSIRLDGQVTYQVWLFDIRTRTDRVVLEIPAGLRLQFLNMGGGCMMFVMANVSEDYGYRTTKWISFDYGDSWVEAAFNFPQSQTPLPGSFVLRTISRLLAIEPYVNPENAGVIYLPSYTAMTETTSTPTDCRLFKSIDHGLTWTDLCLIAPKSKFLPTRNLTATLGGAEFSLTYSNPDMQPELTSFVPVGTHASPMQIDLVNPWRVNDAVASPESWLTA